MPFNASMRGSFSAQGRFARRPIGPRITLAMNSGPGRPLGYSNNGTPQLYISGTSAWATYQNLSGYLTGLVTTTSINDTDTAMSWSSTLPVRVYMIRDDPAWNTVNTSGWTLIESGKSYITGYNDVFEVYQRDYAAGIYTGFDNNSAMYMWGSNAVINEQVWTDTLITYLDASNPISYPTTGTTWTDLSGTSRNASFVNGPTFTSSNGGTINFQGSSYATLPAGQFSFGTGNYTIEAWVKPSLITTGANIIYASQSSNATGFLAMGFDGSANVFFHGHYNGSSRPTASITGPTANNWFHVAAVRSGSTMLIYRNGVVSTSNGTSSLSISSSDPRIGVNPASAPERFNGDIASFRVYSRALSGTEVLDNFNATKSKFGL